MDKFYYSDGTISSEIDWSKVIHREDGPACEYSDGDKYWLINGKLHREDGPARECSNGAKYWYMNDKRHREDGPAIEWSNGSVEYWLNNKFYSEKEFNELISKINKKESTMKEKVIQNFKNDSKKAIVRSGANKLIKTAKSAIVMASSKLSSEQAELVQKMVSSEKGEAGLRLALGYLLTYLPLGSLGDNPKVQLMAEEFRVSGQTIVQDEVIEKLSSIFVPMIQSVVESMPEIEVNVTKKQPKAKTRVAQVKSKVQDEEEEESDEVKVNNVVSMKVK